MEREGSVVWRRVAKRLGPARALIGDTAISLVNGVTPSWGIEMAKGLAYGPEARHRLDVYRAKSLSEELPVVVFFYGGGWEAGERRWYRFVATALAERGFVVVVPDYRVYPDARFPEFVQDAARAVRWVRERIGRRGGDPDRILLAGHSAGAHIAAMLALDARFLREEGVEADRLAGVIGLAGPYDFLPLEGRRLKAIFGREESWPDSQPFRFARSGAPPFLLATGGADRRVRPRNTERLAERLRSFGVEVEEIVYPDVTHAGVLASIAWPLRWRVPVLHDVASFMRRRTSVEETSDNLTETPGVFPAR